MNYVIYKIENIPDVTLNRNRMGANAGVNGLMDLHNSFLRIWNRKGIISDISLHLLYEYVPSNEKGTINTYIMLSSKNEINQDAIVLFESNQLIKKYKVERVYENNVENGFLYCSMLMKNEVFTESKDEKGTHIRYTIPKWKINGYARLYEMFTVMSAINTRVVYRVDIYPVDYSISLRNTVKNISDGVRAEKERNKSYESMAYDTHFDRELDNVLRSYDEIADEIENSPHFITNIFCFCDDLDTSKIILDSAAADAIDEGSYKVVSFKNEERYNLYSFLEDTNIHCLESLVDKSTGLTHVLLKNSIGWKICRNTAEKFLLNYLPVLLTLEEIEPFFKLPIVDDGEAICMRLESDYYPTDETQAIKIGEDNRKNILKYPLSLFNKHAFISGVPGSGKTYTMLHLVTELHKNKVPFLVLEPAKKEYRAIFNMHEMLDVYLFSPHMNTRFPLLVNPFEFPVGISLCEHINVLMKVFSGAFSVPENVYSILDKSISSAYAKYGWEEDDVNTGEKEYPSIDDVRLECKRHINETKYELGLKGNIESFIEVRLEGLMKRDAGEVFNTKSSSIKPENWIESSCIIEMEDMGEKNRNFLTLLLCNYIRETLKVKKNNSDEVKSDKPRHVLFIEEAHNLISNTSEQNNDDSVNPKVSATKFIVDMLAEVRALNESIVIADQLPTSMAPEIMKNTGLKIALRMSAKDEREYIGSTISASPIQVDNLVRYEKGKALVFFEQLEKPMEVQISEWEGVNKTLSDEEIYSNLIDNSKGYKDYIRRICNELSDKWMELTYQVDKDKEEEARIERELSQNISEDDRKVNTKIKEYLNESIVELQGKLIKITKKLILYGDVDE